MGRQCVLVQCVKARGPRGSRMPAQRGSFKSSRLRSQDGPGQRSVRAGPAVRNPGCGPREAAVRQAQARGALWAAFAASQLAAEGGGNRHGAQEGGRRAGIRRALKWAHVVPGEWVWARETSKLKGRVRSSVSAMTDLKCH